MEKKKTLPCLSFNLENILHILRSPREALNDLKSSTSTCVSYPRLFNWQTFGKSLERYISRFRTRMLSLHPATCVCLIITEKPLANENAEEKVLVYCQDNLLKQHFPAES